MFHPVPKMVNQLTLMQVLDFLWGMTVCFEEGRGGRQSWVQSGPTWPKGRSKAFSFIINITYDNTNELAEQNQKSFKRSIQLHEVSGKRESSLAFLPTFPAKERVASVLVATLVVTPMTLWSLNICEAFILVLAEVVERIGSAKTHLCLSPPAPFLSLARHSRDNWHQRQQVLLELPRNRRLIGRASHASIKPTTALGQREAKRTLRLPGN